MRPVRPGPEVRRTTREESPSSGGLPCPGCGQHIEISLNDLLVRRSFRCQAPGCGVVLRLDQRGSAAATDTLRELKARLDDLGARS